MLLTDSVDGVREMIALGATIINDSLDAAVLRSSYAAVADEIRKGLTRSLIGVRRGRRSQAWGGGRGVSPGDPFPSGVIATQPWRVGTAPR